MMKLEFATPESVNIDSTKLLKIEELTQKALDEKIMAGLNMLVARHGKIVYHTSFGKLNLSENSPPVPLDAINSVRSISKPITGVLIMSLVEKGLLDVNDHVQKYIPEFTGEGKDKIRIHHLLTHTTGMFDTDIEKYCRDNWKTFVLPEQTPAYLGARKNHKEYLKWRLLSMKAPLSKPTGKEMIYSSIGYDLLGFIIQVITGKTIHVYAKEIIFKPLGMKDTSYVKSARQIKDRVVIRIPPEGRTDHWMSALRSFTRMAGSYSVSSTVYDIAVLGQMFLNKGEYNGKRIVSERSIELITTNQIPGISAVYQKEFFEEAAWGFGFNIQGYQNNYPTNKAYCHDGYGGSRLLIDPVLDIIIVIFKALNGDFSKDLEGLEEAVIDACTDYEALKTRPVGETEQG